MIRTGGQKSYPWHEAIDRPIDLQLFAGDKLLGKLAVAPPAGVFSELTFNVPARTFAEREIELHTEANGTYRVFHWFVLQPE